MIHLVYRSATADPRSATLHILLSLHRPRSACEWSHRVSSHCSQPSRSSCGLPVWNGFLCHPPQTPPAGAKVHLAPFRPWFYLWLKMQRLRTDFTSSTSSNFVALLTAVSIFWPLHQTSMVSFSKRGQRHSIFICAEMYHLKISAQLLQVTYLMAALSYKLNKYENHLIFIIIPLMYRIKTLSKWF